MLVNEIDMRTHSWNGADKTASYGWRTRDQKGTFEWLHKDTLEVLDDYQRTDRVAMDKVAKITANWSWIAFGAIVVALRDGHYYIIDGMHRWLGSKRRSDITMLPCMVLVTEEMQVEAMGFLACNTLRKNVSALSKHKAMVAGRDATACYVQGVCDLLGLKIVESDKADCISCVKLCMTLAGQDKEAFEMVLSFVADLCRHDDRCVNARLLDAVSYLHRNCGAGLLDRRLRERMQAKGATAMIEACNRAAAFYARGGAKVWAEGIIQEINKGLHNKFVLGKKQREGDAG